MVTAVDYAHFELNEFPRAFPYIYNTAIYTANIYRYKCVYIEWIDILSKSFYVFGRRASNSNIYILMASSNSDFDSI